MEYDNYLMHYGRKNQKWGIRNFQNYDGTWTELGKARRRAMAGAGEAARRVKKALKKTGKVTAATIKRTRKAISDASERSREKKAIRDAKREEKIQKIVAKAIRKNDIETILKYSSHMDNKQLQEASSRATSIANLRKNMPAKKPTFAQKVATDIGKYAVDKGVGLAKKAASNAGNAAKTKATSTAKDLVSKALDAAKSSSTNARGTWSYDELRRQQEDGGKVKKKKYSEGTKQTRDYDDYEWLRRAARGGSVFRDADGASFTNSYHLSNAGRSNLTKAFDAYMDSRESAAESRRKNQLYYDTGDTSLLGPKKIKYKNYKAPSEHYYSVNKPKSKEARNQVMIWDPIQQKFVPAR